MRHILLTLALAAAFADGDSLSAQEQLKQSSWRSPTADDIRSRFEEWHRVKSLSADAQEKLAAHWRDAAEVPALERTTEAILQVDESHLKTIESWRTSAVPAPPAAVPEEDVFIRSNLRLLGAVTLVQRRMYDEAAALLEGLQLKDVVDPAALLFHQAVVEHRLLHRDECLALLARLRENEAEVPKRYLAMADLMEHDLGSLKPDSLDEIGRMMGDVERRLDLGRAGKKVRDEEAEIIAKLEKKIDDLEKKRDQQKQQQQSQKDASKQAPSKPAESSKAPADLHATDAVDPKDLGKKNQWGNLPPKQRQQALQQLGRELPSHFRDTIEEYFKRLAQDGGE